MNCERFNEMLADALGDELGSADRSAFDGHLDACMGCRREYESLAETLDAIRTLKDVPQEPRLSTHEIRTVFRSSAPAVRRFRMFAVLRYAAIIALAFTAGYAFRGGAGLPPPGKSAIEMTDRSHQPLQAGRITTLDALANAHRSNPHATMMTKLMIALYSEDRS